MVVGLPRGGVPVALGVALGIGCPLDFLVSKKIGAPGQPELAVGAVSSEGVIVLNREIVNCCQISRPYLENQEQCLISKTKALEEHWRKSAGLAGHLDVKGKQVILVDDGIATGMTAIAAARTFRKLGAERIILAVPVMSASAYNLLKAECDQIVALMVPLDFAAVGQFYADFHQVEDDEAIEDLRVAAKQGRVRNNLAVS
jgi:predicted phosphoribosyltransferase